MDIWDFLTNNRNNQLLTLIDVLIRSDWNILMVIIFYFIFQISDVIGIGEHDSVIFVHIFLVASCLFSSVEFQIYFEGFLNLFNKLVIDVFSASSSSKSEYWKCCQKSKRHRERRYSRLCQTNYFSSKSQGHAPSFHSRNFFVSFSFIFSKLRGKIFQLQKLIKLRELWAPSFHTGRQQIPENHGLITARNLARRWL